MNIICIYIYIYIYIHTYEYIEIYTYTYCYFHFSIVTVIMFTKYISIAIIISVNHSVLTLYNSCKVRFKSQKRLLSGKKCFW